MSKKYDETFSWLVLFLRLKKENNYVWIRTNLISCFRSDKDQHQQKYWQFPACDLNTTSTHTGTKAYWTTKMFLLILKI